MWTIEETLPLARRLYCLARNFDYHLMLGGSVLYEGKSEKDLDLFFSPLNGYPSKSHDFLLALNEVLGPSKALRDSPDYHADAYFHWREAQLFNFENKRIDVFIQ